MIFDEEQTSQNPRANAARLITVGRLLLGLFIFIWNGSAAYAGDTLDLSYSGRLTESNGAPLSGSVIVGVTFWNAPTEGQALSPTLDLGSIDLKEGIFSAVIGIRAEEVGAIFGDGKSPVYIELTAGGKVYPRQKFSYVPYALRTPVDTDTLRYNDRGNLTLSASGTPGVNKFLTLNESGKLTLQMPVFPATATNIQGQSIATSVPTSGQVLAFNGTNWSPTETDTLAATFDQLNAELPLVLSKVSKTTATVSVAVASSVSSGYLSQTDWLSFTGKVNSSGGTMSGKLDLNGNKISRVGSIDMQPNNTLTLSANENDPADLVSDDRGKLWFDTNRKEVRYYDGSSIKALGVSGGMYSLNDLSVSAVPVFYLIGGGVKPSFTFVSCV